MASSFITAVAPATTETYTGSLKGKTEQLTQLTKARNAVNALMSLWENDRNLLLGEVLDSVYHSGLFEIPELLNVVAARRAATPVADDPESERERDEAIQALDMAMATPFEQIVTYDKYVSGVSPFDTHQGVKGREFPRVMVVIDDEDARGFLFSYEKLLGVKDKSQTDLKHEQEGEETTIDRTRRLFYVTCSRAEDSLAIVNYSADPPKASARVLAAGWFADDEIMLST
jgi:DNA helicase-2/ATP-dependent DNA helicase PcrA